MNTNKALLILAFLIIGGCSDSNDKSANEQAKDDNVFKTQTDALDESKKIEQMIIDAAEQNQQKIDKQSQ